MSKSSDPQHAYLRSNQEGFDAEEYEETNVHSIYESIASHFSNTRHKPWPLIPAFINSLPSGSVGADLGCGNGKYLSLRSVVMGKREQQGILSGNDIITMGLDRSANLIELARDNIVVGERVSSGYTDSITQQPIRNEVGVGDAIQTFYRSQCFDFALSIATIHHFSTHLRRVQAVKELIRIVRPVTEQAYSELKKVQEVQSNENNEGYHHIAQQITGRFLIYVWALEQRGESRRKFEQISEGKGRDLLVPWVIKSANQKREEQEEKEEDKVYQRCESSAILVRSYTCMLTYQIHSVDYHVFEQGELESLVEEAASLMSKIAVKLEVSGWEKGNWYGIWQCVEKAGVK